MDPVQHVVGMSPGLLEVGLIAEGHRRLQCGNEAEPEGSVDLQDVQEDTAAEGSITGRGAYARRLEARNFEPANWERVKQYLRGLGLEHPIGPVDNLGVDDMEDFEFLYREDMEAGASKEEAEAILGCTGASKEGRAPSRPAAQGFQGPAVAARIVHANDRADRARGAEQGVRPTGTPAAMPGSGIAQALAGTPSAMPGSGIAQAPQVLRQPCQVQALHRLSQALRQPRFRHCTGFHRYSVSHAALHRLPQLLCQSCQVQALHRLPQTLRQPCQVQALHRLAGTPSAMPGSAGSQPCQVQALHRLPQYSNSHARYRHRTGFRTYSSSHARFRHFRR